jgi:hypothetical protein
MIGISNERFRDGDVSGHHGFEEVMSRHEFSPRRLFRKFMVNRRCYPWTLGGSNLLRLRGVCRPNSLNRLG